MKKHVLVAKDHEKIKVQSYHKKIRINSTSTIPEVDAKIDRCNLSMKLPKNIVCI